MPATINGIGTTYYGKTNLDRRTDTCGHCGRTVVLESYDTTLWFVVLFIPLIPLGRKRILDSCPGCTRHRVLPLADWNRLREENIQENIRKVNANPNDPGAAVELHGSLVFFRRLDEAARLAEVLADRFAANADVLIYLGAWHERAGRGTVADGLFEKALVADPASPAVRRAVGIGCLERGEIERARTLLAFMEEPGQKPDPAVLFMMGRAHQKKGEHQQALDLFARVLQLTPAFGRNSDFRRAVQSSEQALGIKAVRLPAPLGRLALRWGLPAAGLAVLAAAAGINHHLAQHQTLYIVNGTKLPARLAVDGRGGENVVAPRAWRSLPLAEGHHSAVVRLGDRAEETVEFDLRQSWFRRFGGGTAFVFNLKGAGAVLREQAVYTPVGTPGEKGSCQLLCGQEFLSLHGLDHVFTGFPPTIRLEQSTGRKVKTGIDARLGQPSEVLEKLAGSVPAADLLRYAEIHLSLDAHDADLARLYMNLAAGAGQIERVRDFLGKGLELRPPAIEWHRCYQIVSGITGQNDGLLPLYDRMLAADAGNSGLLYLRGRLEPDAAAAMDYYRRSMDASPKNPYPRFAAAYHLLSRGDLAGARELAAEACRLRPRDQQMSELFRTVRLGLGDHGTLRDEALAALKGKEANLGLHLQLLEVCVAGGDLKAAGEAHNRYCRRLLELLEMPLPKAGAIASPAAHLPMMRIRPGGQECANATVTSWLALLYLRGDHQALLKDSAALLPRESAAVYSMQVNLELDRPAEAEKALAGQETDDAFLALMFSVSWHRAGDEVKAAAWRERALKKLSGGGTEHQLAATLLGRGAELDPAELDGLVWDAGQKAQVVAALAEVCPARRAELLALVRRLNISRWFPHGLLARVAEEK
jgi:tetratricopeptide (TPR) repeat protein